MLTTFPQMKMKSWQNLIEHGLNSHLTGLSTTSRTHGGSQHCHATIRGFKTLFEPILNTVSGHFCLYYSMVDDIRDGQKSSCYVNVFKWKSILRATWATAFSSRIISAIPSWSISISSTYTISVKARVFRLQAAWIRISKE